MIDLDQWDFEFKVTQHQRLLDPNAKDECLRFSSAKDFCTHISNNIDDLTKFQNSIQRRLDKEKVYKRWEKQRTLLKNAPNFKEYQKDSKPFQDAAQKFKNNTDGSAAQIVESLSAEIIQTNLTLKIGQKIFHGSPFDENVVAFDGFLSCTLDPTIAAFHARKKSNGGQGKGTIFIIEITKETPFFFGGSGRLKHEREILLDYGAQITLDKSSLVVGSEFNVIEAQLIPK